MSDIRSLPYRPKMACEKCVFGTGEHSVDCPYPHRTPFSSMRELTYVNNYILTKPRGSSTEMKKDCVTGIIEKDLENAVDEFRDVIREAQWVPQEMFIKRQ